MFSEPSTPVSTAAADPAAWSAADLPSIQDLPALGLVGPGQFAEQDEIEAVRSAGIAVCRRTGVVVCLVGTPRLASRPSDSAPGPAAVGCGLSKRIYRQSGMKIMRKAVKDAEEKAVAIASRLPAAVLAEQRALVSAETGGARGSGAPVPVAALGWAEPAEMRFACGLCPSTAATKKALVKHLASSHPGVPAAEAADGEQRLLQAVFSGNSTGYVHVKAAGRVPATEHGHSGPALDPASAHGLTVEQRQLFNALRVTTPAAVGEAAGEASLRGADGLGDGTNFLFRSGLDGVIKRLGLSPGESYVAAREVSPKKQADGVALHPTFLLEEAVAAACMESYASFKSATPGLKAACIWIAEGSARDDAADASRAKADVKDDTVKCYTRVIVRLVSFIARMITRSGDGSVAAEVDKARWVEDHPAVLSAVETLFHACQEQAVEANASEEPRADIIRLAHGALFEILVKPVPLVRRSVSPLFVFLAASAATLENGKEGTASWNKGSGCITPLTAAIVKMATAVSIHHVQHSELLPWLGADRERLITVRRFRQDAHKDAADAPVSEAAMVMSVGRRCLPAEHSTPSVIPCENREHHMCAFIKGHEISLAQIGEAAKTAEEQFWIAFDEAFPNAVRGGLDKAWREVPVTGVDRLEETVKPWMVAMGAEQERIASGAADWVTAKAMHELQIVPGPNGTPVAQNKAELARVRRGLNTGARSLMVLCTLGTGAPLRGTETGTIAVRGGKGVSRDVFFFSGGFVIIHHRTKASHNFATPGDVQPRKLPAGASAALATWCRLFLPLRDLLLLCGESVLCLSPTDVSPGVPDPALFGGSGGSAQRINEGLHECGLPLTLSSLRQYTAHMMRLVTPAGGGGVDGEDEDSASGTVLQNAAIAAAREQQFGHSVSTAEAFYGKIPTASKVSRVLPVYLEVSTRWHVATGQAENSGSDGRDGGAATSLAAADPSVSAAGAKRAHESVAGQELFVAPAQRRRLTAAAGLAESEEQPQIDQARLHPHAASGSATAAVPGQGPFSCSSSSVVLPSPLLLCLAGSAVVGVPPSLFAWASTQQEQATQYIAAGMPSGDALLVLATGGGKTVTYAASSITDQARLTVVIVPFVALARDLDRRFVESGLNAARFGDLSTDTMLAGCPGIHVVIAGLESVESNNWSLLFSGAFACARKTFLVVEECHVLYFDRYRKVCGRFAGAVRSFVARGLCPAPPMLLVTATAPPASVAGIFAACGSDAQLARTQFRASCTIRRNVRLTVSSASPELTPGGAELKAWITRQVLCTLDMRREAQPDAARADRRHVILVFVETRAMTAKVANGLRADGTFTEVYTYNAGMEPVDKAAVLEKLTRSARQAEYPPPVDAGGVPGDAARLRQVTVVVATVGFGVGLDIPGVCTVCIMGHRVASSLITYAQMAGRAGRDGLPSLCATLLHSGAPDTSFGGFPAGGGAGGDDSAWLQGNAPPPAAGSNAIRGYGGVVPTGDFAEFCLDSTRCRQARLHRFLDGAADGMQHSCSTLAALFFPGLDFESCDVCVPEGMTAAALAGSPGDEEQCPDGEYAEYDANAMSQVTATLALAGALAPPDLVGPEVPPPPPVPATNACDDVLAELAAICGSAPGRPAPALEYACGEERAAAAALPATPQAGVAAAPASSAGPTGFSLKPAAVFAPPLPWTVGVATRTLAPPPVSVATGIAAGIAASKTSSSEAKRSVTDQAAVLGETFRRPAGRGAASEACPQCLSELMAHGLGAGGSGPPGRRGACTHARDGCLRCTQSWRHIKGAANSRAEHSWSSPDCPLAAGPGPGRCKFCWMGDLYGIEHVWGHKCPFAAMRNAALRMFWDNKPAVAALVAHEARRTGVAAPGSDKIAVSVTAFLKFITRDHTTHGPSLAQLVAAAYSSMQ